VGELLRGALECLLLVSVAVEIVREVKVILYGERWL
jgi:hypothetical protein